MLRPSGPTLVTGAAGFIGAHLVAELLRQGTPVTALDRIPWKEAVRLHSLDHAEGLTYRTADLGAGHDLSGLAQGHPVVYHLSANTENRPDRSARLGDLQDTVAATVGLLEACAGTEPLTVVLASSQLVYAPDPAQGTITEATGRVRPVTRFAAGKAAAEAFLSAYAHERGWRTAACRLSNIVGPGMRRGILADIVRGLSADPRRIRLLGDGRQTRSYLHVSDCVDALIRASALEDVHTAVNVCNTDAISAVEVAAVAAEEFPHGSPDILTTGGDRGWQGDLPTLRVHPEVLLAQGWRPAMSSGSAVRATVRALLGEQSTIAADAV
ncbi:NAD-dependent epimerase/dehydratase family protein [Streptomyces sp. NPDC088812]|uniref:NAD-dependent epimerase/dehydratase family protein n=1 Tax=Streptomyces sp. NPDC088812 TaxID=3365905 RepID=UPI00380780A9